MKGEGNQQDYGMRVYDPRIGKFLSVDPLTQKYPELTPYQFASNTPIQSTDLDGAETDNQVTRGLEQYRQMKVVTDDMLYWQKIGTITESKPNWGDKWKQWNDSKSPTHSWAILSRLAYGTLNDGKIAYTTVVDGKNAARGLDNAGVTNYKERIGAGLNTLWLFNSAGNVESKLENELEEGLSFVVGSGPSSKKLNVHNSDGLKWSLSDINARNRDVYGWVKMNNCTNCAVATDSYLKGFPASALYLREGRSPSFLEEIYNRKFTWNVSIKDIKGMVSKPGDLGIVIGIRPGGSAHAFNVYNNRGIIQFLDGQSGKVANLNDKYFTFGLLRTN